jgi:type III pantothenate kinase
MKLLVDLGNSAMKWAFLENGQLGPLQRVPYQNKDFDNLLTQTWSKLEALEGIWISNVAGPQKASILTHWIEEHFGLKPIFIKTSRYECGVTNGYQNPQQLGVDRWLALIGAYYLEKGMLCVVDCGTAITLDVLSANGHHLGGLILPGITTMRNALKHDTYALEHFDFDLPFTKKPSLVAHDTHSGINLGTTYAVIGLLDYVVNSLKKQGNQVSVLLTGGSAPGLEPFLQKKPYQLIPELVLQGLAVLVNQSL